MFHGPLLLGDQHPPGEAPKGLSSHCRACAPIGSMGPWHNEAATSGTCKEGEDCARPALQRVDHHAVQILCHAHTHQSAPVVTEVSPHQKLLFRTKHSRCDSHPHLAARESHQKGSDQGQDQGVSQHATHRFAGGNCHHGETCRSLWYRSLQAPALPL